jgi:hypothetical protein
LLAEKRSVRLIGAVDSDPQKIGKDVGDLAGLAAPSGIAVVASLTEAI